MAETDWIALVKEFVIEQSSGIKNSIFYAEDVGGVKYEFVLEFPDNIPTKTGISGSEIIDINKTLDDTIVNVQRVFPDGEVIVDYSFNAKGKGGDVQALDNFNKILKEGKGMKGVLLEYYDTFPVETTLPTTLENDITIPNTPEGINTPTNVVDDLLETLYEKYDQYLDADVFEEGALNFNIDVDDTGKEYISLQNIAIKDEYQNKGIGKEILNEIKKTSDELSIPIVATALDTEPTGFFAKQGFVLDKDLGEMVYTPTNVVDDIKLTGTTGGNTNVKGNNIAYVDVEELFPYVQYDRRADTKGMPDDYIDNIKKTIYEKGFMYDNANEGVNVFAVFFDDTGNVQINEGNHRLRALFEVAQETGQKIYVPVNPFITKIIGGNKVQNVSTTDAYNAIEQLIRDLTEADKNFDTEYAIETKLGEPGRGVSGLETYTYPGGPGGTSATQSNIKKFFQSIGINAITYDELPDNNIYKTGVNTFTDTPGGSLGAAKLNDPLVFDSWIDNYAKTTTSFIDNLPLSTTVKNQFNNLVQGRARNLATPGGVADAVDVWELGVLGLMIAAVAYKEYDEIPTILTNKAINMFNSMTNSYGIPPVQKEEYDLDYEFINKVVETGEKFMPTDYIIKKVGDVTKGAAETGAVTGFGYVPPNLTKTDTMETTQKIQPGVQEEKMFKKAKPQKGSGAGSGVKIL